MITQERLQAEWREFKKLSTLDKIVLIVIGAALFKIIWWALGTGGCGGFIPFNDDFNNDCRD